MKNQQSSKTLKVFVGGTTPYADNRGNAAIFSGLLELLRQLQGYAFKVNVWHTYPESLQRHIKSATTTHSVLPDDADNLNINIIYYKLPSKVFQAYTVYAIKLLISIITVAFLRLLNIERLKLVPRIEIVQELLSSDFIIELNFGDTFTDAYYGKIMWFFNILRMTLELLSKKPLYLFPQSIGPFNSVFSRAFAQIMLKNAKMIAIRESYSLKYASSLGVNANKLHFVPDMSFWLPIISTTDALKLLKEVDINKRDSNRKLVGIILSENFLTKRKSAISIQEVAKTIDHLIDEIGVNVIFIPHGISASHSFDTRALSLITQKMLKNKEHTAVLTEEYNVEELWGIIGLCDLVISSLTHPVMSSLRQGVPVIGLSYSHKTLGIMKLFHMDKYSFTYDDLSDAKLIEVAKKMIENSDVIKQHLIDRHSLIKENMNKFQKILYKLFES